MVTISIFWDSQGAFLLQTLATRSMSVPLRQRPLTRRISFPVDRELTLFEIDLYWTFAWKANKTSLHIKLRFISVYCAIRIMNWTLENVMAKSKIKIFLTVRYVPVGVYPSLIFVLKNLFRLARNVSQSILGPGFPGPMMPCRDSGVTDPMWQSAATERGSVEESKW